MTLIDAEYNKSEEIASRDVLGWIHKKEWKSIELPKVASRTIVKSLLAIKWDLYNKLKI